MSVAPPAAASRVVSPAVQRRGKRWRREARGWMTPCSRQRAIRRMIRATPSPLILTRQQRTISLSFFNRPS